VVSLVVAAERALLIARFASHWSVETSLEGREPDCVAVDPRDSSRVYCGTRGHGLWRSIDAGRRWEPAGRGIAHERLTAVSVSRVEGTERLGVVYAGTEPSAMFRSDDGGDAWRELSGMRTLPSSRTWSFPPRPSTHHVRWIEPDPSHPGLVYVAIEAGALVRTPDGGRTWVDRVPRGPYDTHTAATHPLAPDRVYAAAGDGYFESLDGGGAWAQQLDGLGHRYLVSVAADPGDPDTVVVSAAAGPHVAYRPRTAEAYVYRKSSRHPWQRIDAGLPDSGGTVASHFATHQREPGVIYAVNNRGAYRSGDAGQSWAVLDIPWPSGALDDGVSALTCLPR